MGMSSGGNEGLFKLAENAAPDENRLMPSERSYPKSSKTISIDEAVALMKKRKKDPSLRIKGGLDDNTASLSKKSISDHKDIEDQKKSIASGAKVDDSLVKSTNDSADKVLDPKQQKGRITTSDLLNAISFTNNSLRELAKSVDKINSRISSVESHAQNTDSKHNELEEFKASSHRVTFILNGMEITVKCLNQVKDIDAHSLVFVFSDDGDSFFVPPMQSELEVKYDGVQEPGKVYYFGMCFSVKSLGLKFLGFLYDESSAQ